MPTRPGRETPPFRHPGRWKLPRSFRKFFAVILILFPAPCSAGEKAFRALVISQALLQGTDLAQTARTFEHPRAAEGNPLLRDKGTAFALKTGIALYTTHKLLKLRRSRPKAAMWSAVVLNSIYLAIVVRNDRILSRRNPVLPDDP